MEKLVQILPWMMAISSRGRPADLKVKINTITTNTTVRMLMIRLSFSKELRRSLQLVVSPTA